MTSSNFWQEDTLCRIILNIIADYQPITTMDIWYELGEDHDFNCGITHAEVNETLFHLERQKWIVKGEDDIWQINRTIYS